MEARQCRKDWVAPWCCRCMGALLDDNFVATLSLLRDQRKIRFLGQVFLRHHCNFVSHLPYDFVTSVSQSSLRRFLILQLFLTAEFVRWRHLHCSMICHHLLWCGQARCQAPLPISVNENGGAYVSVPKADVYAI